MQMELHECQKLEADLTKNSVAVWIQETVAVFICHGFYHGLGVQPLFSQGF